MVGSAAAMSRTIVPSTIRTRYHADGGEVVEAIIQTALAAGFGPALNALAAISRAETFDRGGPA